MQEQRPLMKHPWLNKNILGFSIASLFSDSNHEIVPLVLPALLVSLVGKQAAPTYVGFISAAGTVATSVAVLISGWLSDKITNRKPLILIGYILTGVFVGALAFAHSWQLVLLFVLLAWLGRGLASAPRNAIIADSIAPAYYGHAFGFRQAFDTLGAILGPLVVYLLSAFPLRILFSYSFIPGILAIIVITFFVSDVPHRISRQRKLVSFSSFSFDFYMLVILSIVFGLGNFNRTLLLLRIQNTLELTSSTTAALSLITLLYIFRNVIQTVASYYSGAISDTIGRKIPLAIGFGMFGLMALLLIYSTSSLVYLITVFFLSGASAGIYTSLLKAMAADAVPESLRGTGFGILQITASLADLASSSIVGYLWSAYSAEAGFSYAALISFAAIILLIPKTRAYA